jgi:hypothetical protein
MRGFVAIVTIWALLGSAGSGTASGVCGNAVTETCELPVQLFEKGLGRRGVELVQRELQEIWAPCGIAIVWTGAALDKAVRIEVDRPVSALPQVVPDEQWPVAVVQYANGHILPPVYASVDAAERVARSASPPYSSPALAGIIVPRILGRAIAHELAHVLLDTREHAASGLLRRRFSADEFASPVRNMFLLTPDQSARARIALCRA